MSLLLRTDSWLGRYFRKYLRGIAAARGARELEAFY
jgi:hypothetical protein